MEVAPFRALRYAADKVGELAEVVSLPYDQIDEGGRDARYLQHPFNVVRLIRPRLEQPGPAAAEPLPATRAGGAPQTRLHQQARNTLVHWQQQGVLVQDPLPSLYPYRQRFSVPGSGEPRERWAFIGLVRLSPLGAGPISAHEGTFPGIVEERSGLRRIVGADLGLILMLYDDPDGEIDASLRRQAETAAVAAAVDEAGISNELWRWSDAARLEALVKALRTSEAIIADGHHRYTAALHSWQQRGARPEDPAGWVMAALVSMATPGLTVLPIHRLVRQAIDPQQLSRLCGDIFQIDKLVEESDERGAVAAAEAALERHAHDHAFVLVQRHGAGLRADAFHAPAGSLEDAEWPASVPAVWRRLDVAVLRSLVLEPWLGRALEAQREESGELSFSNRAGEAVGAVANGRRGAAVLLSPLDLGELRRVVQAGEVLPSKSTNFHPKAISGLTFHRFDSLPAVEPERGGR
ncbi:MAG: DUF1015 family protein [Acidobacteriota bacterium]